MNGKTYVVTEHCISSNPEAAQYHIMAFRLLTYSFPILQSRPIETHISKTFSSFSALSEAIRCGALDVRVCVRMYHSSTSSIL